jgi:hypothetical protein
MVDGPGGLKVPKTPIRVELALEGAAPRAAELFLSDAGDGAGRRAQLLELLADEDDDFLPVRDPDEGVWTIVNKAVIAYARVPRDDGPDDAGLDDELFDVRRPVELHLVGDRRLVGDLLYSPAAGRARVTDHLNDSVRYVRLWTADAVYYVARRYLARLIER